MDSTETVHHWGGVQAGGKETDSLCGEALLGGPETIHHRDRALAGSLETVPLWQEALVGDPGTRQSLG